MASGNSNGKGAKRARGSEQERAQQHAEEHPTEDAEAEFGDGGKPMAKSEAEAHETWRERDKDRRARFRLLPKPPVAGDVELLYSKLHHGLRHLSDGEMVMTVIESEAWQGTLGERCRELDAAADPRRAYTHEECERALLYQRLLGKRTYEAAHKELCSASANGVKTRQVLGLDRPRDHIGPNRRIKYERNRRLEGVPSPSTMSRYRRERFPEDERAELYAECFMRMVEEHAERYPEFRAELRVLGFDGTTDKTIWRPRWKKEKKDRIDEETGEVFMKGDLVRDEDGKPIHVPAVWEGGSATNESLPEAKRGHGWKTITGHTGTGLPISARIVTIEKQEGWSLLEAAKTDLPRVRAAMDADAIGVCTTDGAYAWPAIRRALRGVGFIENTHSVAHGKGSATERNLKARQESVFEIEGYPKWRANGLRELFCMCGHGTVTARPSMLKNGTASVGVEGTCKTCGDIHVTSGDWRVAQNPSRFVRINPKDAVDVKDADMLFGNPLTWGDKRAKAYGNNRYAQGEGLHGTAATRFGIHKDGAYYTRTNQVRIDVLHTYCLMHGLAMKARELGATAAGGGGEVTPLAPGSGGARSGAPPGDAVAA